MLFPVPEFPVTEYGYGIREGATCPACSHGQLFNAENKLRRCDHCFTAYPGTVRNLFQPDPDLEGHAGYDHYRSLQHYAAPPVVGQPAVALSDFVLDIDRDNLQDAAHAALDALHLLEAKAPGHVRLYFSGKKGFHLVIPAQVFGFEASEMLGAVQRRMARSLEDAFGIELDASIYSRARLFRRVGSRHTATGLYKVEVQAPQLSDLPALLTWATQPRPAVNTRPPQALAAAQEWYQQHLQAEQAFRADQQRYEAPALELEDGAFHPCIQRLLDGGPPREGTRHKTYVTLAGYLKSAGHSRDEARALLVPWTQQHPTTHTDKTRREMRYEMEADVRSVYRSPNVKFHCQYAMALGVCDPKCPLFVPLDSAEKPKL